MRAPPEHETMMAGCRRASAISNARVIFSPADHAQAAADERVLHRRDDDVEAVEASGRDDHRILEAGALTRLLQAIAIGLGVGELQWVGRCEVREVLVVLAVVEERSQSFGGAEAEMMRALGADVAGSGSRSLL